jgi:hypothetical protein
VKNKKIIGFIIIILFIICGTLLYRKLSVHKQISSDNISSIQVWGVHVKQREANKEEKEKIMKEFNSINSIRRNKDFQGTTPNSGITIKLKSGDHIIVIQSGIDFEIQRPADGKQISYWGKNKYIKELLNVLSR